jgi:hypothetical protein
MADFITLTCLSCGGKLEITKDIERFACGYCGNEQIVKRGGGIVSLAPLVDEIKKIQTGVDKTSAELAITRLKNEIESIKSTLNLTIQNLLKKYDEPQKPMGLKSEIGISIALLIEKKDKAKLDFRDVKNQIRSRFISLSNEDINYIVYDAKKIARDPKIYENEVYVTYFDELLAFMKQREESVILLNQKENEINQYLQIVNS